MSDFWPDLIKYTLPALVVFLTAYLVLRAMLEKDYKIKRIEYKMSAMRDGIPIRLQAYERITLFMERIAFNNLLHRVRQTEMNSREFQMALLANIRSEFEHNITQQIYVTPELWALTKAAKEEVISIINRTAQRIPPEIPSLELSKHIFAYLIESEQPLPTEKVLEMIKTEVSALY